MIFKNECGCIFDSELLAKAVDTYCRRMNVYCHETHRITIHNNYPTIVISRKHLYVHDLLRIVLFDTRKGYVVHHVDFNKLNNSVDNLAYISNSRHTQIHSKQNWEKIRAYNIKVKREPIRKDILDREIKQMITDGIPVKEIARHFNCHHNTIYKRMSKWKT